MRRLFAAFEFSAVATLGVCALVCADSGCKGNSDKDKAANKSVPRPVKNKPPPKLGNAHTPKVRGRSLDWATLAKKQVVPKPQPKGKVSAQSIPRTKQHRPLRVLDKLRPTGLRAVYVPSKDKNYDAYRKVFQEERIFDILAHKLNRLIKFPRVIDIQMSDCGEPNAFYDEQGVRIIICYELLAYYLDVFLPTTKNNDALGTKVIGATLFAFFHELGHAMRDQLQLAATANEEQAVDELATHMLLKSGDDGLAAAFAAARWFAIESKKLQKTGKLPALPFWAQHSLTPKRFVNIACLIYGSAPNDFGWMVKKEVLPAQRAKTCANEYKLTKNAWETLLKKHFRAKASPGRPKGGGPPCHPVANHIARLARQAFRIEIINLSLADQQTEKQLFIPKLNNFKQTALLDCQAGWTAAKRRCMLTKTRLKDLGACTR